MDSVEREARKLLIGALGRVIAEMSDEQADAFWREYRLLSASADDGEGAVDQAGQVGGGQIGK